MWLRINLPLHARTKFKETLTPQLYPPRHGANSRHRAPEIASQEVEEIAQSAEKPHCW